jgi:hypothetical protein
LGGLAHRMNKWQIICPGALLALVALLMVHQQAVTHSRDLAHAVGQQLDSHAGRIATLLVAMKTNDTSSVEDAALAELQQGDPTSLIGRSDLHVTRASSGSLECVIDTSRWGIPTRRIR